MLKVVRMMSSEKFADKFSRDFYPKLRRTVNRYGTYSFTTLNKVFKSGMYSAVPFYMPVVVFKAAGHCGGFLYRFLHNEVDISDIDLDDVYAFLCDNLKSFCYNVLRDTLIRSFLLTVDPVLNPAINELAFVGLTVVVDTIPVSAVLSAISKLQGIINEYKERKSK